MRLFSSLATVVLVLAFGLFGCDEGGTFDFGPIEDAEDVQNACDENADSILTETFTVEFETTTGGCPWGQADNLDEQQGVLTARVEQIESLDLDEIIICDMEFNFAGEAGLEQDIEYDDNFLFIFNGVVLASSYKPWIEQLPQEDVFYHYDWSEIVGQPNEFDNSIPTYCVGEDTDLADCVIPPPETPGPISLSFDLSITSELSYSAIDESRAEFGFIATGDNDPQSDCSHDAFYFEVDLPYLPL